ncbi:hypothetical protein [Sandarakinorhabdus sp.]|uniref:hypothetical protein n=1 Tax=Sandarakinorhabdus sp. TaxID=1916663 RepID=UPI003F722426
MPPQPLSSVRKNADILTGPSVFVERPQLAILVMRVISLWSSIDSNLAQMLSSFLKADFAVGAAMYASLSSGESKRAALLGAARQALSPNDFDLLNAVLKVSKASRLRRNEFAHHVWGISPQLVDALLLIHPINLMQYNVALRERSEKMRPSLISAIQGPMKMELPPFPRLDTKRIYVFKDKDLLEDVEMAQQSLSNICLLSTAFSIDNPYDEIRQILMNNPSIAQSLSN